MATKKQMAEATKEVLRDFKLMYEEYRKIQEGNGYNWKYRPLEEFPAVERLNKMIEQVK